MTQDALYLGAFWGILIGFLSLNFIFARLLKNNFFYQWNGAILGLACFFALDKQTLSVHFPISEISAQIIFGICPLFVSLALLHKITSRLLNGGNHEDRAYAISKAFLFLNSATILIFLFPVFIQGLGAWEFAVKIEGFLLPGVFIGLLILNSLGLTVMGFGQSNKNTGSLKIAIAFTVVYLTLYSLISYRLIPFTEITISAIRLIILSSLVSFTFALVKYAQFESNYKNKAVAAKKERAELREQTQRFREATSQAHILRVLRREKELEAELREHEVERAEALHLAKEAADEMARSKSQFLAVMSHEIRTPLNGIMGMVKLLMSTPLSHLQRDYVQTLNYSGDTLLAMVNDMLDLSKIEAGKLELENINFDLRRLISSIIMLMSARASEKGLIIRSDIPANVPAVICGDPTRLRQIFLNLINNAIKFTDQGSITLGVVPLSDGIEGKQRLRFEIRDTGIGIPESARDRLFKEFSQVDASTTRLYGGTGLGLSICKELTTAMGGQIGVDSVVGKGSTFWFMIDFFVAENDALGEFSEGSSETPKLSIMVVEDNEIHQKVIGGYLRLDHHDVTLVGSAEAAFEALDRKNYDVILMDVNLPGIDGNAATRLIRAMADPQKNSTPIVAITGNTSPLDIEGCHAAGMNDFLGKPVDPDELREAVFIAHRSHLETQSNQPSLSPKGGAVLRILVVDDNDINQKVIAGYLQSKNYSLETANDGETAVKLAASRTYDAIMMDVTLPGIDGLEASRQIRAIQDPARRNVPIISISGNVEEKDREACRAAGMNDFVGKPINPDELKAVLNRINAQKSPTPPTAVESLDDYLPQLPRADILIDETVLKRLELVFDSNGLTSLLEEMLAESIPILKSVQDCTETGDTQIMRVKVHTLKGMAMTLGIVGLGEFTADIESAIVRGESMDILKPMVAQLTLKIDESRDAIEIWLRSRKT